VRIDADDVPDIRTGMGYEAVDHWHQHLADDHQVVLQQQIVHGGDGALDGVLHRHDAVLRIPPFHSPEHRLEVRAGHGVHSREE